MLQTTSEATTARIATEADAIASYIAASIAISNRIASSTLGLPVPELNDWLNAKPLDQRFAEFAAHGLLGEQLNAAAATSESTTGKPEGSLGRVDVRSVQDKLADMNRTLEIVDGAFVVTENPPPAPEPEPEPEPAPDSAE